MGPADEDPGSPVSVGVGLLEPLPVPDRFERRAPLPETTGYGASWEVVNAAVGVGLVAGRTVSVMTTVMGCAREVAAPVSAPCAVLAA